MLRVASEAGVGGGGDGWSSSAGCIISDAGGTGAVDGRSCDNNEPSKKAFDLDLVIISLFGSTGRTDLGTTDAEAEERKMDFRAFAFVVAGAGSGSAD